MEAAVLNIPYGLGGWMGIPLIQGKSAYQSALDGGYNGSEAQFNIDIATTNEVYIGSIEPNGKIGYGVSTISTAYPYITNDNRLSMTGEFSISIWCKRSNWLSTGALITKKKPTHLLF